jgi:hypothetical protein
MQTLPVNCNRCGSAVEVGPDTRHVTCAHCPTPLVVIRTASSVFTDLLARQKELERIDREWEEEKQREHTFTDKAGRRRTQDEMLEPTIVFSVLFGLVFLVVIPLAIANRRFDILLVLLLLVALVGSWGTVTVAQIRRYWRAEARYRERRGIAERQPQNDTAG